MTRGPLGGRRPASNSSLKLVVKDSPVPSDTSEGVFPEPLLRMGSEESSVAEDIADRTNIDRGSISVDKTVSVMRGLGQTDKWTILINVSGMTPSEVDDEVDTLVDAGYLFSTIKFE